MSSLSVGTINMKNIEETNNIKVVDCLFFSKD